ncbi:putative ABC transporter ATP-binding protein [Candidatus Norongarragalina meridionalis]|nr:putative ABC transporter ATP-binding protein [Candidatus Norongarragalina meridionalis]
MRMDGVSKEYLEGEPFAALNDINLEIRGGELVSITGPSGSGKSTMLHLLGCLDKPTKGEIYLEGKPVSGMTDDELAEARRNRIGFVFQAFNLAPTLDVFGNVELPLVIKEANVEERRRTVDRLLSAVGLTDKAHKMPSQLSGGQKQRVAIARALANSPAILLADEPTGNLDSKSGEEAVSLIIGLCKKHGMTAVFVTHDAKIAARTERQIRILDGKIESDSKRRMGK